MPDTRISLILRLPRSADAAAWREFVELYEPLVLRFARRRGLQDADAQDLVQRVFSSVAGAVDRWQPDAARGKFRAWLFRIARNHLINQATARNRERPVGGSTQVRRLQSEIDQRWIDAGDAELEYRRVVFESAAARVKRLVQPATWSAFWETMVEGRTCESVAEDLQMSVGAIYVARSRVVARLRAVAEELEANDEA
jgi:RNA polymerase sigma factor (sigma-70 family)